MKEVKNWRQISNQRPKVTRSLLKGLFSLVWKAPSPILKLYTKFTAKSVFMTLPPCQ